MPSGHGNVAARDQVIGCGHAWNSSVFIAPFIIGFVVELGSAQKWETREEMIDKDGIMTKDLEMRFKKSTIIIGRLQMVMWIQ